MIEVDFVIRLKDGEFMHSGLYSQDAYLGAKRLDYSDLGLDDEKFLKKLRAFSLKNARYYSLSSIDSENKFGFINIDYWDRSPETSVENMGCI